MATGGSSIAVINQYSQQHGLSLEWEEVSISGPSHQRTFVVRLTVGEHVTEGQGSSKKLAKEDAAKRMIAELHGEGYLESKSVQDQRSKISILQELCQKSSRSVPRYSEISRFGPPNDPTFTFAVAIHHPETGEELTAKGEGRSKDKAKTNAAAAMLEQLYPEAHHPYPVSDSPPGHAPIRETSSQYVPLQTHTMSQETSRLSRTGPLLVTRGPTEGVHHEHPVPKPRTRPPNAAPLPGQDSSSSPMPLPQGSVQNRSGSDTQYTHLPTASVATQSMYHGIPAQPPGCSAEVLLPPQSQATPTILPDGSVLIPDYSTSTVNPLRGLDSRRIDVSISSISTTLPPAQRDRTHPLQTETDQTRHCVLSDLGNLPDLPSIGIDPEPVLPVESTEASGPPAASRPIPKPRKSKPAASTVQETQRECDLTMQAEVKHNDHAHEVSTIPLTQAVTLAAQAPQSQTVCVDQANTAPHISEIPDTVYSPLEFVKQQTAHLGTLKVVPLEGKDQNDRHVCFLSLSQVGACRTMTALGAGTTGPEAEQDAARCLWRQLTGQGTIVR